MSNVSVKKYKREEIIKMEEESRKPFDKLTKNELYELEVEYRDLYTVPENWDVTLEDLEEFYDY
jgi:hypothetical protein